MTWTNAVILMPLPDIHNRLAQSSLIDLPKSSIAPLTLLLVAPILLLGADYFFDGMLKVQDELRKSLHYRSVIYVIVIAIAALVLFNVRDSNGYLESVRITTGTLVQSLAFLAFFFVSIKWWMKKRWESIRRKNIEKLELELPQYLEMFHILITSGMSVLSALKILGDERHGISHSQGGLPGKQDVRLMGHRTSVMREVIKEILASVENGTTIERSLDAAVFSAGSEQLRRFSDAVILGMERGSSMGQTLKNLIGETRNQSKILVMQRAGKAEIQLLIPVVFLILPISVMFAIWPSYVNLVSIMG